jgi:uncharacterized metal-binding protein YceD (DUF177 family)
LEYTPNCFFDIQGHAPGREVRSYCIGESFFAKHPIEEAIKPELRIMVYSDRAGDTIKGHIEIEGSMGFLCDRCLEECRIDIESDADFLILQGSSDEELDGAEYAETHIFYAEGKTEIDFSEFFASEALVAVPLRKDHGTDDKGLWLCNPEMIDLIKKYSAEPDEKKTDVRWEGLKNIKFN